MIRRDYEDVKRFPELKVAAQVRCSNQAHEDERLFVRARAQRIAHDVCLLNRLGVVVANEAVDSRDIPRLAIGGSGGGYRATFGFLSSLQALHQARTLDAAFWLAGVSGSCWTIAALYTVAPDRDPARLVQHYKSVAAEGFHPMSSRALDVVARSAQGVYFLLAPLLSKIREGNVGIGIMDMYATLTTSYQLLSRSAHARPRLSRSTFQFSKIWQRCGLQQGLAAMPIFTAVRVVHPSRSEANGEKLVGQRQSTHHRTSKFSKTAYQWWEVNPLEVGSSDEGAWVPAWSYGRSFVSGRCVSRSPEISLSMLLGQATSAPAGPLTGYITTLLATLPRGTLMSKALASLNEFVRHKRWQRRWGNPIRGADEANPLYGFGARVGDRHDSRSWEGRGRLKLMDSGLSNNLPNHIFTTSARQADIILSFDQSSDVKTGAGRARLDEFARERGLILVQDTELGADQAAQVFRAWRMSDKGQAGLRHTTPFADRRADLYIIYCPLLPHRCQPDFDPTVSKNEMFS
jgi:phospholipase A2